MDAKEHVAFLAGSTNRVRVLRALRERPGRGADLARRCSVPRSTVHRCLDGLATRGWVMKHDGSYRLTTPGAFVLRAYEDLTTAIEVAAEHEGLFGHLGTTGRTLPAEGVASATLIEATPENPYVVVEHFVDVFESASFDRLRGIAPITSRLLNDVSRPLVEAGVELEIVTDEAVLEAARETHATAYQLGVDSDNFELSVYPESLPLGLAVLDDDRVLIGAYDDAGNPRACLDGTSESLIEWGTDTYDRFQARSQRVERRYEREAGTE